MADDFDSGLDTRNFVMADVDDGVYTPNFVMQTTEIPNTAREGDEAFGWRYFSDGTAIAPSGKYYYQGQEVWSPDPKVSPTLIDSLTNFAKTVGTNVFNQIKGAYTKDGKTDWGALAATAGGLYGLYQGMNPTPQPKTGYQGGIPSYTAVREQVEPQFDPNRRPGSGGLRYFSDTTFAKPADVAAARTAAEGQAAGLGALNRTNPANQRIPDAVAPPPATQATSPATGTPASQVINRLPVPTYAQGGVARYLRGGTDGMADKIKTDIDGAQEARLSHGEFVIPADVVSHLGNGNSESGAQRLYAMMDKVRKARTGTTKQGTQINPDKFMPK